MELGDINNYFKANPEAIICWNYSRLKDQGEWSSLFQPQLCISPPVALGRTRHCPTELGLNYGLQGSSLQLKSLGKLKSISSLYMTPPSTVCPPPCLFPGVESNVAGFCGSSGWCGECGISNPRRLTHQVSLAKRGREASWLICNVKSRRREGTYDFWFHI